MIVTIDESTYEMDRTAADMVLTCAEALVKHGIYAVEDEGYIELKNEEYDTDLELVNAVTKYRLKGFRVHYNGTAD